MNEKQKNMDFFSKQLYKAIKENNLERKTNKELGAIFNVSSMTLHRWVSGKMMPSMARIPYITKVLGVSVGYHLIAGNIEKSQLEDSDKIFLSKYKNLSVKKKQILENIIDVFNKS